MKLLQGLARWILRKTYPYDVSRKAFFSLSDMVSGTPQLRNPYEQVGHVYACVNAIARNFKRAPLRFLEGDRDGENVPIGGESPVVQLFRRPNPITTKAKLLERHAKLRYLRGGCGWILLGSNGEPVESDIEVPTEIWVYPASRFTPIQTPDEMSIAGWKFRRPKKGDITLKFHQVMMSRFEDPDEPLKVLAPLVPAMIAASQHFEMDKWNEAMFRNDATPSLGISFEGGCTPEQKEEAEEEWNDKHGGSWKKFKTVFLQHGAKIQKLGDNHRDMQFLEGKEEARKLIQTVFGVNDVELGLSENVNRATSLTFKEMLWQAVIIPEQGELEDELNPFVERWTTGKKAFARFDNTGIEALKQGYGEKLDQAGKMQGLGCTIPEINEKLELGWKTDELPEELANLRLVNTGLQNMESLVGLPDDEDDEPSEPESEEPEESKPPAPKKSAESDRKRDLAYWDKIIKENLDPFEKRFISKLNRLWRELRAETLKNLKKKAKVPAKALDDIPTLAGYIEVRDDWDDIIFNQKAAELRLTKLLAPIFEDLLKKSIEALEDELGGLDVVNQNTPELVSFVELKKIKVKRVVKTVRKHLRKQIKLSLKKGESIQELSTRIRKTFKFASTRSLAIARTETGATWNGTRYVGMAEEGIKKHRWIAARDEETRKTHAKSSGHVREIGKTFPNGLIHPHEEGAPAGEVVNCRCLCTPVK